MVDLKNGKTYNNYGDLLRLAATKQFSKYSSDQIK